MTRGRHPIEAIKAAMKIAERRGLVQCMARRGRLCDFEIVTPHVLAKVRIKRMGHVRLTPKALEREAAFDIADLKMYPSSQDISRELWICSKKYFIRFFRVTDAGLVELGPDGGLLPANSPPTGISRYRRVQHPVRVTVPPEETGPAIPQVTSGHSRASPGTETSVPVPPAGDSYSPGPGES